MNIVPKLMSELVNTHLNANKRQDKGQRIFQIFEILHNAIECKVERT